MIVDGLLGGRWVRRYGARAVGVGVAGLAVVLLLAAVVPVVAQSEGALSGQVLNGTADGPAIGAGVPVTLRILLGDTEKDTVETTTDATGSFRFDGLDTDPALEYWIEARYLDVTYAAADPYRFGDGQAELTAEVTVYETTTDGGDVTLDSVHFIAESFGQVLRITEIHLFGNQGDRTYVGQPGEGTGDQAVTVEIPIPATAVGLSFDAESPAERFVDVPGGVADTEPVSPGSETTLAFFSYHLVVDGSSVPLERTFAYPVTNLGVLVAQPGLTLRSDQLASMGLQSFQGRDYEYYAAPSLEAGAPLSTEWLPSAVEESATTDTTAAAAAPSTGGLERGYQGVLGWFGLALALLAVGGVVVYTRTGRGPAAVAGRPVAGLTSDPRARRLLVELADLEDDLEAGRIDEDSYERQRQARYDELKALW